MARVGLAECTGFRLRALVKECFLLCDCQGIRKSRSLKVQISQHLSGFSERVTD